MPIAAIWDASVGYTEYGDTVGIETSTGRVAIIRKPTFDYLYYRLDDFTAALKEDCIYYTERPDYVELRNHLGQTRDMDYVTFHKNYDTLEE